MFLVSYTHGYTTEFICQSLHSFELTTLFKKDLVSNYWVTQKLPQIDTVIAYICIGMDTQFAVYICGNIWKAQFIK